MLIEAEAIRYEPARLRGERLLVLAPHPDDEVIGCGGLAAQHLREHRAVRIVVATDGAAGGHATTREEESQRGIAILGDNAEVEFLRFRDRLLDDSVSSALREQLLAFRPDLILVPSPIEIHPDHAALARVFCELIQHDEALFAELAIARVAFYEVGQTLRPNAIVDISDVAEAKWCAIAEHKSQLASRDYLRFARGLNAYRAMTLPRGTEFAEGYYVVDLPSLRTMPFSALRTAVGAPPAITIERETVPISVVIRTKDRPALLREAIDSVRANGYPCELVVVNDGGARPEAASDVKLVEHESPRGRSEAANAGVRAATSQYIAFLDDDDLYYPEHLATLATQTQHVAAYTDAVSAFLRPDASGTYQAHSRQRIYATDFDRDLLLVDNYIPLPTLLIARASFLDAGGFDPTFDLFEDWDFLIRLARRGDFLHIPRVTCEVRHFEGGGSIVLAAPEGSPRFRDAKLQVWAKHADLVDQSLFARVIESQKRRLTTLVSDAADARGNAAHALIDVARLEREKNDLLAQILQMHEQLNGAKLLVAKLEGRNASLEAAIHELVIAREERLVAIERLTRQNDELQRAAEDYGSQLRITHVEIERLNGLLAMIYRSRTWKLHTLVEKLKGRG
ncbi:MAG TPA: PIG-L family deacetylase [Thermoanaerobaculia bacterium]|nr:PIG-L family deacetylase [Thermoanaerobaculia bacterium]